MKLTQLKKSFRVSADPNTPCPFGCPYGSIKAYLDLIPDPLGLLENAERVAELSLFKASKTAGDDEEVLVSQVTTKRVFRSITHPKDAAKEEFTNYNLGM